MVMSAPHQIASLVGALRVPIALVMLTALSASAADSTWVYPAADGRLLYARDALGNRIPDFSSVGYHGGTVPIPKVPVRATIAPVSGDDGSSIQTAINLVSALPLDTNGFRGAVLLRAGEYQIAGHIEIRASGVVLRGEGDSDAGTLLRGTGTDQRTLITVLGSGARSTVSGTTHNVLDKYVPVGALSFTVDGTSGLAVNDRVVVRRPSPANWIQDIGMDQLASPWTAGSRNQDFDRVITRLEGNRIFLDAPITTALEQRYGGGTIFKYNWSGRIQNVGIEDLAGRSDFTGPTNENHAWTFISFATAEHGWVRRVTSQYFGFNCVALLAGAKWITIADCKSLDPKSQIVGSRRYAFHIDDAQLCLFRNCYTREDRHQFITGSSFPGPVVFVDGVSDNAYNDAGTHHRWFNGGLWDSLVLRRGSAVPTPTQVSAPASLNMENRGNIGTGHGWTGANSVAWNCQADGGFIVQNPPTARNWLVGALGAINNGTNWVGPHDPGTYDSPGTNVFPHSLYWAQMQDRLAAPGLQVREYIAGDFDNFTGASAAGDAETVDAAWLAMIRGTGSGTTNFDVAAINRWVPFTFNYVLAPTDSVVAATLTLSLRTGGMAGSNALHLDSLTNNLSFAALRWSIGPTSTVKVLDLANHLNLLRDGRLNAAISDSISVDWAVFELRIAPGLEAFTIRLAPEADAFVRGGDFSTNNFGGSTALAVQETSNESECRRTFLRWDLSRAPRNIAQAKVRLMPVNAGMSNIENAVAMVRDNEWNEWSLPWNVQPALGHRFASWQVRTHRAVEFVVTPQVHEALSGEGKLSLEVHSVHPLDEGGRVDYASREHPVTESRPQLILLLTNTSVVHPVGISLQQLPAGKAVALEWSAQPGKTYHVLCKDSLTEPTWKTLAGEILPLGSVANLEVALGQAQQFYQVLEQ